MAAIFGPINFLGFATITGAVHYLKGTLVLHMAKSEDGTVEVAVAADSVDTGIAARETALQGPTSFNVARFSR